MNGIATNRISSWIVSSINRLYIGLHKKEYRIGVTKVILYYMKYCFLLDLEGHIADSVMADCLKTLQTKEVRVKFLGSYPAAGDHAETVREESKAASVKAQSWLDAIRSKLS